MTKSKSVLFWILAILITISSAVYQRMTGPTYPLSGKSEFANKTIKYKFERSHTTSNDCEVKIAAGENDIQGTLFWRRYKYDKKYHKLEMSGSDTLKAYLPKQAAAGKLEYFVHLKKGNDEINLPSGNSVVIRYKNDVPMWVLIPHVIAMFLSMLFAVRIVFEYFNKEPRLNFYLYWIIGILFVGGFILGPIMQKYAFGEYWTGVPFGYDLTDNKTLVAMIGWLIALFMLKRSSQPFRWVLFAAILMFIVYLIPHSVLGSELDYSKVEQVEDQLPQ